MPHIVVSTANKWRSRTSMHRRLAALAMAMLAQLGSVQAVNAADPAASSAAKWENVTDAFFKQLGLYDKSDPNSGFTNRCRGLIVTPDGDVIMQTAKQGICVSKDQGATWSVVAGNRIFGRCGDHCAASIAYPYDGRMAFFGFDGEGGTAGGISLDGAKTWKPFSQIKRGVEYADVDWGSRKPNTIFGVTHEPFLTVLSSDGGETWTHLFRDEDQGNPHYLVGVINEKVLVRYNLKGGCIEMSEDEGRQIWVPVAYYRVRGSRPVHYGRKVFWTCNEGVIVCTDGSDWELTGEGAAGAWYGPYFGLNDQEFVVVTERKFLKTVDGGKTWKPIADFFLAPEVFSNLIGCCYFGWDAKHNILYASGIGASVYRLKLASAP